MFLARTGSASVDRAVGIYFAQLVTPGAVNQSSDLENGGHAGKNLGEFMEKPND